MTAERVALASLSGAMDGGFTAIADVSGAMTRIGAADEYRLIGGVAVMLHIQRLRIDLPLRASGPSWPRSSGVLGPEVAQADARSCPGPAPAFWRASSASAQSERASSERPAASRSSARLWRVVATAGCPGPRIRRRIDTVRS